MSTNLTKNTNVLLFSHRTMLMIARIAREQFQGVFRELFVFFVSFVDQTLSAYQLHGVLVCPQRNFRSRPAGKAKTHENLSHQARTARSA
jgi:hypothetical protein